MRSLPLAFSSGERRYFRFASRLFRLSATRGEPRGARRVGKIRFQRFLGTIKMREMSRLISSGEKSSSRWKCESFEKKGGGAGNYGRGTSGSSGPIDFSRQIVSDPTRRDLVASKKNK